MWQLPDVDYKAFTFAGDKTGSSVVTDNVI